MSLLCAEEIGTEVIYNSSLLFTFKNKVETIVEWKGKCNWKVCNHLTIIFTDSNNIFDIFEAQILQEVLYLALYKYFDDCDWEVEENLITIKRCDRVKYLFYILLNFEELADDFSSSYIDLSSQLVVGKLCERLLDKIRNV
nr:MAG: hypothetical protein [Bee densovirus 4]